MTILKRMMLWGAAATLPLAGVRGADLVYENTGQVLNSPQIDAVTFINSGLFNVSSSLPYETQNTLNFINTGSMSGNPGFRFENISSTGVRKPATSFFNGVDAQVFAQGFGRFVLGGAAGAVSLGAEKPQIIVNALTITNRGRLHSDADGLVRLVGKKIDVSRSSVGILPFAGGSGFVTETNFVPEVGIFDNYWGMDNTGTTSFGANALAQANPRSTNYTVTTGAYSVTNQLFIRGMRTSLRLTNASVFVSKTSPSPTNMFVDVVFVQAIDPELKYDVRFNSGSDPNFKTAVVQFSHSETNVLAGGRFNTEVYLIDRAASETNFVELTNLLTLTTFMPSTYEVTRLSPPDFLLGQKANTTNFATAFTNANPAITNLSLLFQNNTYSNGPTITNVYSAYSFRATNLTAELPNVVGASLTNLPGRIEINGDEVNLDKTRIRAEGIVALSTSKLTGGNIAVDSPNLNLDLRSSDGNLAISGLTLDQIERMTGNVAAWTAIWTNQTGVQMIVPDPNNPGAMITNDIPVEIGFHVLVVDSSQVRTRLDMFEPSFIARSTNVVIADTVRVKEALLVEAENLTVTKTVTSRTLTVTNAPGVVTNATVFLTNFGKIILTNTPSLTSAPTLRDWNAASFPLLKNLTNDGIILLPGTGFFGTDRSRGYASMVNRGSISGFNHSILADTFVNGGTINTRANGGFINAGVGTLSLQGKSVTLTNGLFEAGGQIDITANDLFMRGYSNTTQRAFVLTVTNSISEGGLGASNQITCEGFQLLSRPGSGDLLGTTITSSAPVFLEIPHIWAGADRGPTTSGFSNNVAVGRLVLRTSLYSTHSFAGTGANNALYVDFLDIQGPGTNDVQSAIELKRGFKLYFADSNLAADKLNGMSDGRLVWVKDFVGPSSAVAVSLAGSGQVILMNRALRESTIIDSDGDGIVNSLDASPRDDMNQKPMVLSEIGIDSASRRIRFSWLAAPNSVYRVEYSTSLTAPNWTLLSNFANPEAAARTATIQDSLSTDPQRFYRVLSGQ